MRPALRRVLAVIATAVAFGAPILAATPAHATQTVWRYTAATSPVTDSHGDTWTPLGADIVGGWNATASPRQVYGTTDDALFYPERVGLTAIHVPLPAGTYDVQFLVAETDGAQPGQRVYDVAEEGTAAWNGLDIAKTVGQNVRLNVRATRTVTDGTLDITVSRRVGYGKVNALQVTRLDTAPAVKVMPLGDSITYGMDPSSKCPPYQSTYITPQGSYRVELGKRLTPGAFQFSGNSVDGPLDMTGGRAHEGHCGIWIADNPNTYDLLHKVDGYLSTTHPQVIVLDAGTNDLYFGASPDTTAKRLTRLLDRITADEPHARILVTTLCHAGHADVTDYNRLLPGVVSAQQQAGHHVTLVDMATAANLQYPADYQDPIHPNVSGYVKMGDALAAPVQAAVDAVRAGQ